MSTNSFLRTLGLAAVAVATVAAQHVEAAQQPVVRAEDPSEAEVRDLRRQIEDARLLAARIELPRHAYIKRSEIERAETKLGRAEQHLDTFISQVRQGESLRFCSWERDHAVSDLREAQSLLREVTAVSRW